VRPSGLNATDVYAAECPKRVSSSPKTPACGRLAALGQARASLLLLPCQFQHRSARLGREPKAQLLQSIDRRHNFAQDAGTFSIQEKAKGADVRYSSHLGNATGKFVIEDGDRSGDFKGQHQDLCLSESQIGNEGLCKCCGRRSDPYPGKIGDLGKVDSLRQAFHQLLLNCRRYEYLFSQGW